MIYYKVMKNGKVMMIGTQAKVPSFGTQIAEEEYRELEAEIETKAEADRRAIEKYVEQIKTGEITLEEVPADYRREVEAIINAPAPEEPNNPYGIANDLYNQIEQGVIDKVTEGVKNNEQDPITGE